MLTEAYQSVIGQFHDITRGQYGIYIWVNKYSLVNGYILHGHDNGPYIVINMLVIELILHRQNTKCDELLQLPDIFT